VYVLSLSRLFTDATSVTIGFFEDAVNVLIDVGGKIVRFVLDTAKKVARFVEVAYSVMIDSPDVLVKVQMEYIKQW
jgi:hypothetical protein